MPKTYARKGGPERAEAYRLRDLGIPVADIARQLGVAESTAWRWFSERPAPEHPLQSARRHVEALQGLLGELHTLVETGRR